MSEITKTCVVHGELKPEEIYVRKNKKTKECRHCILIVTRNRNERDKLLRPEKLKERGLKYRYRENPLTSKNLKCSGCSKRRILSKFSPFALKARYPYCKECMSSANRESKLKNKGTYEAYRDKSRHYHRYNHLRRKYNITEEDFMRMERQQNGVCAICFKPETSKCRNGDVSRLHVDHNHETGEIRGLLCNRCNRGVGFFKDEIEHLKGAIRYLDHHKNKNSE